MPDNKNCSAGERQKFGGRSAHPTSLATIVCPRLEALECAVRPGSRTDVHTKQNTRAQTEEKKKSNNRFRCSPSLSRASLLPLRGRGVSAHPQRGEFSRHVLDQVGGGDRREGPAPRRRREGRPRGAAPAHPLLVGKPGGWDGIICWVSVWLGLVRCAATAVMSVKKGRLTRAGFLCGLGRKA